MNKYNKGHNDNGTKGVKCGVRGHRMTVPGKTLLPPCVYRDRNVLRLPGSLFSNSNTVSISLSLSLTGKT